MRLVALLATVGLWSGCSRDLPSIELFVASRTDLARGDPLTFAWHVNGASELRLDPRPGAVTGTGVTIGAAVGGDYTLVASNDHGSVSATIPIHLLDIALFAASPAEVVAGQPVTLSWKIAGASSASLDGAAVDALQGSVQVNPTADTTYRLTAHSSGATATATALVRIGTPPVITSFTATPNPLRRGTATVLSWQAPGAQAFSLSGGDGAGPIGGLHSRRVRPLADSTTYTLTASSAFGSATRDLVVVLEGPPGTSLKYTSPPTGGGESLRLVEAHDPSTSPTHLVLRLEAARDLALDGLALNLPFDGATPGSRDGIARVSLSPGGVSFSGLDYTRGSVTPAIVSAFPASGPLGGVLLLGMAQKPAAFGGPALDAPIPAGTPLATFGLDLHAAGGTGPVFDGTTGDGFRLRLKNRAGDVQGTVAVGRLEVQ
ncbi:MAG TPA: hypothetical protein VKC58_05120 [Myxococcales bacterium]|nr:hypothetical protein [Myxococcales bacterium]